MSVFCYKKITASEKLSVQFKNARERLGKTITDLSASTRIPTKYLEAIEQSRYQDLPAAKAFRLAYIKQYAEALGIDASCALKQCARENGFKSITTHPKTGVRQLPFASWSILVRNVVMACMVFSFLGYLGWQVSGVLEPPKLVVFAPFEGDTSSDPSITVQGETDPETHLTINGQEVMANEKGAFETKIDATDGLNTITISATKKHGKTSLVTRHVVVRQKVVADTQQNKLAGIR